MGYRNGRLCDFRGVFNTYSVVQGLDQVMPVDVYLPGCPPRPEALIHAIMEIQKKIEKESVLNKITANIGDKPQI